MAELWLILLIGFLALDTTIAFQTMIAQPIFACSLIGGYLGNWELGIFVGMLMQLPWINIIPAGATRYPAGNLGSMVIAVLVIEYHSAAALESVLFLALVVGIAVSFVGQWATVVDRRSNSLLLKWAHQFLEKGHLDSLAWLHWLGGLKSWLLLMFQGMMGIWIGRLLLGGLLPGIESETTAFSLLIPVLWGIGLGLTFYLAYPMFKTLLAEYRNPGIAETLSNLPPSTIRIDLWDHLGLFFRSFFIQATWNYRSMLSIGFYHCMAPTLKKLYSSPPARKAAAARHLEFFNTHPYLGAYALGVSHRLEEDYVGGEAAAADKLTRLKNLLVGILGGLGDRLFWGTAKPATLILGVLLLYWFPTFPHNILSLLLVFLLYNALHLYIRYRGISLGYQLGLMINRELKEQKFHPHLIRYTILGFVAYLALAVTISYGMIVEDLLHFATMVLTGLYTIVVYYYSRNFFLTLISALALAVIMSKLLI